MSDEYQSNIDQTITTSVSKAEREAAKFKESMKRLEAQTKSRAEAWKMPRANTTSTSTSTSTPSQTVTPLKHQRDVISPSSHEKPKWPKCNKCFRAHNSSSCFLTDKLALEKFLKGKSQGVKEHWKREVAGFEGWMARKAHREAEHKAFLEREARREQSRRNYEAFLARKHEEFLARQAKRDARAAEEDRPKTKEEKKAKHERSVRAMIRNGGGFYKP